MRPQRRQFLLRCKYNFIWRCKFYQAGICQKVQRWTSNILGVTLCHQAQMSPVSSKHKGLGQCSPLTTNCDNDWSFNCPMHLSPLTAQIAGDLLFQSLHPANAFYSTCVERRNLSPQVNGAMHTSCWTGLRCLISVLFWGHIFFLHAVLIKLIHYNV